MTLIERDLITHAPLLHYHDEATPTKPSEGYPGLDEGRAICGSWYPLGRAIGTFWIDDAPMGGIVCGICKHRDEHPGQYR